MNEKKKWFENIFNIKAALLVVSIISCVAAFIIGGYGYEIYKLTAEKEDIINLSYLGQFYSGTVLALFTLSTVLLIILAYLNQREEIYHLKVMNDKQDNMIKTQIAKDEYEKFERTFYRLLDWHMSFMNSISYVKYLSTTPNVYVSRGAINQVFSEFQHNYNLNIKLNKSIDESINSSFDLLLKQNDDMQPYYNNLYSVLEFVDNYFLADIIDEVEVDKFMSIIVGQLSNSEVLLLCYYGLYSKAPYGTKTMIENYSLLRNIKKEYVGEDILNKYEPQAFKPFS